jgi:hypothetical protein
VKREARRGEVRASSRVEGGGESRQVKRAERRKHLGDEGGLEHAGAVAAGGGSVGLGVSQTQLVRVVLRMHLNKEMLCDAILIRVT